MVALNMSMLRLFAGNNAVKMAFIDRVMACAGERVEVTGIDVGKFIESDVEEAAFYALVNAVVPMRFSGASGSVVREFLSVEQANAMRVICTRLQLPFDLYVTTNYRLPMRDFEEHTYRALGMGWDGALSFNHQTGRARFWVSRCQSFKIGHRSWASMSLPSGAPPSAYADGASEFEYTYDAESRHVTLLGTPTIDDVVLERRGDDLYMKCGDIGVSFVNMELRCTTTTTATTTTTPPLVVAGTAVSVPPAAPSLAHTDSASSDTTVAAL